MKKISIFLILMTLCLSVYADALKDLSALLQKVHSAKASFSQTIITEQGQVLQDASGIMRLLKPGYFFWKIEKPNQQLILIKSNKVYLYQQDLQQLTVKPFNVSQTQTPAALLLSGDFSSLNQQYFAKERQKDNLLTFILLPKKDHQLLKGITITFDGDHLVSLSLFDHFNHVTKIIFKDFYLNPGLSASAFAFSPPKGTDIVNE